MIYHRSGPTRTVFRSVPSTASLRSRISRRLVRAVAVLLFLLAVPLGASAQRGVTVSFLPDEAAGMTIEQAASEANAAGYKVYVPSFMTFSLLPDSFNGAIWMRFVLDPSFEKPVSPLRVDLGTSLPGITRLYLPREDGAFTVMSSLPPQGIFTLPEDAPLPDSFYARLDGVPDLWFRPHLGPADGGLQILPLHFILGGFFAVAMLFLFIQYVRKAEEWRLWGAITAGCGIVAALLSPIPAAGAAFTPLMVTGMVVPGLTLLLYAHTARHLFDSPRTMPGYDKVVLLVYILGAAVALAPLLPGFLWVSRYLTFANILLLLLVPMAMAAMARSLKGGFLFFCACVIPLAGVAASAWELTATDTPLLAGNGGLWGLALAMALLVFIPPAPAEEEGGQEEDVFDRLNRNAADASMREYLMAERQATLRDAEYPLAGPQFPAEPDTAPEARPWESVLPQEPETEKLPGPSLPGDAGSPAGSFQPPAPPFTTAGEEKESVPGLPSPEEPGGPGQLPVPAEAAPEISLLPIPDSALEERFPVSLPVPDRFIGERPASLDPAVAEPVEPAEPAQPEPFAAGIQPDAVSESPASLSTAVSTGADFGAAPPAEPPAMPEIRETPEPRPVDLDDTGTLLAASAPEIPEPPQFPFAARGVPEQGRKIIFDLPLLVKNAYDAVAPMSEEKSLGLTWFIAPQTGRLFEGEADLLESALRLLLRDMTGALTQGNVRLNVRRLPNSPEAGHLVFTIVEWNAREVPHSRNMSGLAEAWALAERTGGIFSVEHSPTNGTTVIFSAVFAPMDKPMTEAGDRPIPMPAPPAPIEAAPLEAGAALVTEPLTKPAPVLTDHAGTTGPRNAGNGLALSSAPARTRHVGFDGGELLEDHEVTRVADRLIIADTAATSRARTASVFTDTPYAVLECVSPADARDLYHRHPSALIIMNADMPEVDILAAMNDIHADDKTYGRTPALSVVLVGYEAQADRLLRAGCTRAVMKSMVKEELLAVVEELVPLKAGGGQTSPAREEASAPPALEERVQTALADIPPAGPGTDATAEAAQTVRELPVAGGIFDSILPEPEPEEKTAAEPASPPRGMGLLDMIITDEDDSETLPVARTAASPQPGVVPGGAAVSEGISASGLSLREKENITPAAAAAETDPAGPETPAKPPSPPKIKGKTGIRITVTPPVVQEPPSPPENSAVHETPAPLPAGETEFSAAPADEYAGILMPSISIPVPGEEDSVFKDMLPLVPGLIAELTDAANDAARGREEKSPLLVQDAAGRIAGKAGNFGLTRLERMARCVERAAAADDIEPMECVLSDLETWIERYKKALLQVHREAQW